MRQMNVHHDEVGTKAVRFPQHLAPIGNGARFMPMCLQQVTKKFEVEFIVLDDQNAFRHRSPMRAGQNTGKPNQFVKGKMRRPDVNGNEEDAEVLALRALAWVLSDDARAARLLDMTGMDPHQLRAGTGSATILAAVIDFLAAYEPDLVACARALEVPPERLAALGSLER